MTVREVYVRPKPDIDWQVRMLLTQGGSPKACSYNVRLVLENDPRWEDVLGACQFSYRIVKLQPPPMSGMDAGAWAEEDSANLRHWLAGNYGFEPRTSDVEDAVLAVAHDHAYHPVRDYLESITWDREPRIDTWLMRYMGADDAGDDAKYSYLRAVGRSWLISAVARVMRPPVKVDYVLILEGPQRKGKSTALEILGGDWFSDSHFTLGDRDGYQFIRGKWIVELAELDSFNKAESTRAKMFFSSSVDRYRASYGRLTRDWPRQCVFAGSTNQNVYLRDATGNARYWPVACGEAGPIELDDLRRDRDQIWAEAASLYRAGERWWPTFEELSIYTDEQESRFAEDAWEPLIVTWLDDVSVGPRGRDLVTTADILEGALSMKPTDMRPPEQTRVGLIMTRLGWTVQRVTVKEGSRKRRPRVYIRPNDQVADF